MLLILKPEKKRRGEARALLGLGLHRVVLIRLQHSIYYNITNAAERGSMGMSKVLWRRREKTFVSLN